MIVSEPVSRIFVKGKFTFRHSTGPELWGGGGMGGLASRAIPMPPLPKAPFSDLATHNYPAPIALHSL